MSEMTQKEEIQYEESKEPSMVKYKILLHIQAITELLIELEPKRRKRGKK